VKTDYEKAMFHLNMASEGYDTAGAIILAEQMYLGKHYKKDCNRISEILLPVIRTYYHKEKFKVYQRHSAFKHLGFQNLFEDYEWKRYKTNYDLDKEIEKLRYEAESGKESSYFFLQNAILDEGRYSESAARNLFKLTLNCANKGSNNCKALLGRLYLSGLGTTTNIEKGYELIKEAADNVLFYILLFFI